ncbi:uncharacterized protein G2W53_028516 [Senna tora]|uniref:Uncharacterized protein n=1 Tax=Senna tora TaxID=362788 RepID=A0A834T639_9FABA|nr:uncharacterized protein G2W53_028516 [Senna tora]
MDGIVCYSECQTIEEGKAGNGCYLEPILKSLDSALRTLPLDQACATNLTVLRRYSAVSLVHLSKKNLKSGTEVTNSGRSGLPADGHMHYLINKIGWGDYVKPTPFQGVQGLVQEFYAVGTEMERCLYALHVAQDIRATMDPVHLYAEEGLKTRYLPPAEPAPQSDHQAQIRIHWLSLTRASSSCYHSASC